MSKCKKCGGAMLGPVYSEVGINNIYQHECLIYTCQQCGYRYSTDTNDKMERQAKLQEYENFVKRGLGDEQK